MQTKIIDSLLISPKITENRGRKPRPGNRLITVVDTFVEYESLIFCKNEYLYIYFVRESEETWPRAFIILRYREG